MKEKNETKELILSVDNDLTVSVIPDGNHEFVMVTREVATGYGITVDALLKHLQRKKDELIEGKHYMRGVDSLSHPSNLPNQPDQVFWTKRGIVRLGFFIKSKRAKRFRDWAEDLIVKLDEQRDLFGNAIDDKPNYRQLKKQAFELVVMQGEKQKEVANKLNISEKTMSEWSKQGNWREQQKNVEMQEQSKTLISRFFATIPDICEIEDKELRMRIANKLIGEEVIR